MGRNLVALSSPTAMVRFNHRRREWLEPIWTDAEDSEDEESKHGDNAHGRKSEN
jgi:hypothetical protein